MKITGKESNDYILKELGSRIKDIRIREGITQEYMCELAGLSHSSISRIENGENVKIDTILNMMRALSILGNLETTIPEQIMSPTRNLDEGKKRKRVSVKKSQNSNEDWKWGEEK